MRISTNSIFQAGIAKISQLQADQSKLQQQIATGTRILTPADDPVAAAGALQINQAQSINTQFAANRQTAQTQLNTVESSLSDVTNLLQSAQSALVSAGNGSYSDNDRASVATELQSSLDQLVSLANARDGAGNYLYSGFQTATQPYLQTAAGATYQGDNGQRLIQVSSDRQLAVSETGDNVFKANGNDIFNTLSNLITLLKTPVTDQTTRDALNTGLATASTSLQSSLDNVLTVRASVGSNLKELDALDTSGQNRDLQYAKNLSDLQDLDYAKAISQLTQQQTILQAAQQSYVKTVGLSLFNYLS